MNRLARPITASLRLGNTASFKEMWQRWRAVGNTVFDLTARDLNFGPPAPETNALLLDQEIDQSRNIFLIFYLDSIFLSEVP